jgi:hypothetical protein
MTSTPQLLPIRGSLLYNVWKWNNVENHLGTRRRVGQVPTYIPPSYEVCLQRLCLWMVMDAVTWGGRTPFIAASFPAAKTRTQRRSGNTRPIRSVTPFEGWDYKDWNLCTSTRRVLQKGLQWRDSNPEESFLCRQPVLDSTSNCPMLSDSYIGRSQEFVHIKRTGIESVFAVITGLKSAVSNLWGLTTWSSEKYNCVTWYAAKIIVLSWIKSSHT